MQKIWMALGTAAALASPLISVHAASQKGLVSTANVAPHGTSSLSFAPRSFVPQAITPPVDDLRFTFGPAGMDPSDDPTNAQITGAPEARTSFLASVTGSTFGFDGLSHYDQRFAGTGVYAGTQFSEEPPDQAMAVGNGFVVEAVNNAIAVYKTDGTLVSAATPMVQFLGLQPTFNRGTQVYGSVSLSDPRAYYDPTSKRFFIEEWGTVVDPTTGANTGASAIYVAVSQTSDPTGGYSLYTFDTTFDPSIGTTFIDPATGKTVPANILPDYVQIGADANGFYMSINQFASLGTGYFLGPRILAVSKSALVAGGPTPIVSFSGGDLSSSDAGFTVQPAKTPAGGAYASVAGGTEYFLSSIFSNTAVRQLGIWAITNTASLKTKTPSLTLTDTLIASLPYTRPTSAIQKTGPIPYGASVGSPENRLSSGDTRMTSVTYVQGHLYSALETSFAGAPANINSGFTYFSVTPSLDPTGSVTGTVNRQGYVRVAGETVSYPTLGINSTGGAVITCSLIGPDFYPSAAFVPLDSHLKAMPLTISSLGAAPSDGFTGYGNTDQNGNPVQGIARWGDYSEAQADENGDIWMAQEMVSSSSATRRSVLANYGTHITKVVPTSSFSYK